MEKSILKIILILLCIFFGGMIAYNVMKRLQIIEGLETATTTIPTTTIPTTTIPTTTIPTTTIPTTTIPTTTIPTTPNPIPALSVQVPIISTEIETPKTAEQHVKIDKAKTEYMRAALALTAARNKPVSEVSITELSKLESDVIAAQSELLVASTNAIPTNQSITPKISPEPISSNITPITTPQPIISTVSTFETKK
jgi:hypothetical protein